MVALTYTLSFKLDYLKKMVESDKRVVYKRDLDSESQAILDIICSENEIYCFLDEEWELVEDVIIDTDGEENHYYEVVPTLSEWIDSDSSDYDDEETQSDLDFIDDSYISDDDPNYSPSR